MLRVSLSLSGKENHARALAHALVVQPLVELLGVTAQGTPVQAPEVGVRVPKFVKVVTLTSRRGAFVVVSSLLPMRSTHLGVTVCCKRPSALCAAVVL